MIRLIKKTIIYTLNFIKKFVFFGLNRFYIFLVIYLSSLLVCNFIIQDISNRIIRLEMKKKVILVDISHKEAKVSEKIINIINQNKGNNIQRHQIKIIKHQVKKITFWQKVKRFLYIKRFWK